MQTSEEPINFWESERDLTQAPHPRTLSARDRGDGKTLQRLTHPGKIQKGPIKESVSRHDP